VLPLASERLLFAAGAEAAFFSSNHQFLHLLRPNNQHLGEQYLRGDAHASSKLLMLNTSFEVSLFSSKHDS
jgi:hypothetical protein